jgi:hypothetical protein
MLAGCPVQDVGVGSFPKSDGIETVLDLSQSTGRPVGSYEARLSIAMVTGPFMQLDRHRWERGATVH